MSNELTNKESVEKLKQYIESIENLEDQKSEINEDIKERFADSIYCFNFSTDSLFVSSFDILILCF